MIERVEDADSFTEPLASLGYRFHSSSTERHYYVKGDSIDFHLSVAYAHQGGFWSRQIMFRDYLRSHSDVRDSYEKLKRKLLQEDPSGTNAYFAGKSDFVYSVLRLAGWKEGQKYDSIV
jgi:GrpB-like predicted nucleotidyltransferase (UPF0157 family)